mmetsp:Transcript_9578/g.7274  ORF Transcript_9578/g.7274 Transcript_9578/m.7274 type:complete len:118 (+) Transcript_9578:463-816(+)
MHSRIIVKHLGLRYTKLYETLEILYIGLYFYGRVVLGTGIVYRTVTCAANDVMIKFICIGITLQSYYYISIMFQIIRSRFAEFQERKQKGISMGWFVPLDQKQIARMDCYKKEKKPS